ncbi:MAG: tRNA (N(6)-L-threonylcarbamoyladenosine(37)-C(2))-methylthiotransferase MtaB [Bacilli bacterium]|nr:tRNA (N(6)-L-threonylcarbamoyladenosine(37)-C(2))-methylthiotransferase MtaB [Bacilli bacterium]
MMKFKIISLGCKVNSYECQSLASLLIKRGHEEAKDHPNEEVGIAIINTCSVTATADQKSRQHIRKLRNNYPNAIICVMGCYSQKSHDFIINDIKADIVVGTSNRHLIPDYIDEFHRNHQQIDATEDKSRFFSYEELGITSYNENVRAYLKIQDGCDNFCSYCIIPFTRGKSRSRDPKNIIDEAKYLIEKGYKEIVITGIHVGGYGNDLVGYKFSDLIDDLSSLEGLYSLRISSIEESEIDERLITLVKERKNIAKHLHIPLQSGSKSVLQRMNRKYNCDEFLSTLRKIRKEIPDIALTTDVIVGFPGESEEEFNETYEFIKKCDFNMLHVFPFSARENTKAIRMPNQIAPDVKKRRVNVLLDLSETLWDAYTERFDGHEVDVLVEEYDEKTSINRGHTTNYLDISFKNKDNLVGKVVKTTYKKQE